MSFLVEKLCILKKGGCSRLIKAVSIKNLSLSPTL